MLVAAIPLSATGRSSPCIWFTRVSCRGNTTHRLLWSKTPCVDFFSNVFLASTADKTFMSGHRLFELKSTMLEVLRCRFVHFWTRGVFCRVFFSIRCGPHMWAKNRETNRLGLQTLLFDQFLPGAHQGPRCSLARELGKFPGPNRYF